LKLILNFKLLLAGFIIFFYTSSITPQNKILQRNSIEIPDNITKLLQNDDRKLINLNGEWNFAAQEYNINTKIQVPSCYDFKGKAVVIRNFDVNIENLDNWNFVLHCDGINYQCEISINGKFIEKHEGGFTQFSSLVPEGIIKESGNEIEIQVDNFLDNSKTLPLKNTYNYPKNYGGIFRDIYILAVPKVFIKQINLNSEIDINFNADITNQVTITSTDISNIVGTAMDRKFRIRTEILDSAGNVKAANDVTNITISANSTVQSESKFELLNPQYWSPDNPYLYTVKVSIYHDQELIDDYKTNCGIYEVSQKSNALLFNKVELVLKGINYIEEFPASGISASYSDIEYDVKNLKSMGCNSIKISGRPASPYLIDLCNRYGLLIFEEIPVNNIPANIISNENFIALAENYMSEIIINHKNSPCIFAYGIGNDFDVSDKNSMLYVKRLSSFCKSVDNKLVYYSSRNYNNDICKEFVDLVGINLYDRDLKFFKDIVYNSKIKKERIFISNYGKVINPSNFSGYSDPSSIESESKYIVDFYKIFKASSFVGSFYISYTDWNSDFPNLKNFDHNNQYIKTEGLFGLNREQRPPAIILRKEFLDEDIPNLNIGTYSKESPLIFTIVGLFTFILFIYLTNSVRRFRENVWRALLRPFIFFTDVREQNLLPSFQNIILALIISLGNGLFFANLFYFWKDSQFFDMMLSIMFSRPSFKSFADQLILSPFRLTLVLTIIAFIRIFFISVIIWLFSLTSRFRIGFKNIYTVTVWGLLPSIFLLIFGIFYIRILYENSDFVIIGLVAAGLIYLISIYRILNGTYIIFDISVFKVYAYGILTIFLILGGVLVYLNTFYHLNDYFRLILAYMKN
jgi:hypothetical protein